MSCHVEVSKSRGKRPLLTEFFVTSDGGDIENGEGTICDA